MCYLMIINKIIFRKKRLIDDGKIKNNIMNTLLFLGSIGTSEILLIAFVVLLLFGGKKIPELMRGIGKGVRNFKEGVNGIEKDINKDIEIKDTTESK